MAGPRTTRTTSAMPARRQEAPRRGRRGPGRPPGCRCAPRPEPPRHPPGRGAHEGADLQHRPPARGPASTSSSAPSSGWVIISRRALLHLAVEPGELRAGSPRGRRCRPSQGRAEGRAGRAPPGEPTGARARRAPRGPRPPARASIPATATRPGESSAIQAPELGGPRRLQDVGDRVDVRRRVQPAREHLARGVGHGGQDRQQHHHLHQRRRLDGPRPNATPMAQQAATAEKPMRQQEDHQGPAEPRQGDPPMSPAISTTVVGNRRAAPPRQRTREQGTRRGGGEQAVANPPSMSRASFIPAWPGEAGAHHRATGS